MRSVQNGQRQRLPLSPGWTSSSSQTYNLFGMTTMCSPSSPTPRRPSPRHRSSLPLAMLIFPIDSDREPHTEQTDSA